MSDTKTPDISWVTEYLDAANMRAVVLIPDFFHEVDEDDEDEE